MITRDASGDRRIVVLMHATESSAATTGAARRLCFGCGKDVSSQARRCPHCRRRPFLDREEPSRDVDALSVVAVVLSAGWFFWLGSLAGVVLGYRRLAAIDKRPEDLWGRPLAAGAVVLGWAGLAALVLGAMYLALRLAFHYVIN